MRAELARVGSLGINSSQVLKRWRQAVAGGFGPPVTGSFGPAEDIVTHRPFEELDLVLGRGYPELLLDGSLPFSGGNGWQVCALKWRPENLRDADFQSAAVATAYACDTSASLQSARALVEALFALPGFDWATVDRSTVMDGLSFHLIGARFRWLIIRLAAPPTV